MPLIKIDSFGGMVPAVADKLLPDTSSSEARNAWLYSGELVGLPKSRLLHELSSPTAGRVFRLPADYKRSGYLFDSVWMEFENADTDVVRAPVFNDIYDRYYWASSGGAPRYNTRQRINNGLPPFILGVPSPGDLALVVLGGSGANRTTSYVVTYMTAYDEEGPPSNPVTVTGFVNGNWRLTIPIPASNDVGINRNITSMRVYKSQTGSNGIAEFYLLYEGPTATQYDDTAGNADISNRLVLVSTTWTAPPVDLQGFITMPNGIVASWRENELWFSEPYRPHAWPAAYVHTVEYPIVGLGISNQSLVVCTRGFPVTVSGTTPSNLSASNLTNFEPCTGRGSILSAPEGVYYSSPNGLIRVRGGSAENVTRNLITKDKWGKYTGEARFRAARLGNAYMAFGSVQPGVFQDGAFDTGFVTREDYSGATQGIMIDPDNERVAFGLLDSSVPVFGLQNDVWSSDVFILRDGAVHWLDLKNELALPEVALWRSKVFQSAEAENFGAMEIFFDVPNGTPALNPIENVSLEQELANNQYGLIRLYADKRLIMTSELRNSGEVFKLPSGFKADFWQFEFETRVKIKSVAMAGSAKQLRQA